MCAPSCQNKIRSWAFVAFSILFSFISYQLIGQTVYDYTLDNSTVHISPIPTPVGGIYPPSDYNSITKPLVAEPFSTNPQLVENAGDIHANAAGMNNVFFGGDEPSATLAAAQANPILTKQTFNVADFPIYLETNVYIEENTTNYNECYFWIGPADYYSFCAPRSILPSPDIQEGILVGGWVNRRIVMDLQSPTEPIVFIKDTMDNAASVRAWYNYQVIMDTLNGNLVFRDMRINNQCVFNYPIVVEQAPWLDNFRLALCVDDLAQGFKIITKYSSITADFILTDPIICPNTSIDIAAESDFTSCHNLTNNYQWQFPGANITTSNQQNPTGLSYPNPGDYPITLVVSNAFETDTVTKYLSVTANLEIDFLGGDTSICDNQSLILDANWPNASYLWSDNSTNETLSVSAPGLYWCEVSIDECSFRDTIQISLEAAAIDLNLGNDTTICPDSSITIDAFNPDFTSYLWQDGSSESSLIIDESGLYHVMVSTDCSSTSDSINITTMELPLNLDLGADFNICEGDSILLDATTENGVSYLWQDGSMDSTFMVYSSGSYAATVSNECTESTDNLIISSENCCQLFIPNVFSPNNDGVNDEFGVLFTDEFCDSVTSFSLKIFDRWGAFIYHANNINDRWNGRIRSKGATSGVYVWIMEYHLGSQKYVESGDVTLLR